VRRVAHRDEHALLAPVHDDFGDRYREPSTETLFEMARPYLPNTGALGEMLLSVGKTVWLARNGADGIVDISPFSCMNGIVAEAIYPRVSRDYGGIPIRTLYFDGTPVNMDRTLGVFLEAVRAYQSRKPVSRPRPCPWVK
jgi:predicted nucleotide-binding protein (sugar kinase/HSP70/actin superfamily)